LEKGKITRDTRQAGHSRLNREAREKRIHRLITLIGTFAVIFSILLVGTGYYVTNYRPYHQIVMKVNGREIDMRYYVQMMKLAGQSVDTADLVEQAVLLEQAATNLGVTVSEDEIRAELIKSKIPVTRVNMEVVKPSVITQKLLSGYFEEQTPLSALQREVQAMFLESEAQANQVKARVEAGADFSQLAAELSLDQTTRDARGNLGWHPKELLDSESGSIIIPDYAFSATVGEIAPPLPEPEKYKNLGYWLIKIIERKDEDVHALEMLLSSEQEASSVRARLQAGEDWGTLAKELSQAVGDKENGGDIGFVKKGDSSPTFETFVFDPSTLEGVTSQPIKDTAMYTKGGYWLVNVLNEDKDKLLSNEDRAALKLKLFQEWGQELRNNPDKKVETYITDAQKQWALEQANKS
jgi:hypothetical protein